MITYWFLKSQLVMVGVILDLLNSIPGVNSINEAIAPYTEALNNLITSGSALIGYFLPLTLLKVLIPIVITIEIVTEGFNLFQWIYNKIRGC